MKRTYINGFRGDTILIPIVATIPEGIVRCQLRKTAESTDYYILDNTGGIITIPSSISVLLIGTYVLDIEVTKLDGSVETIQYTDVNIISDVTKTYTHTTPTWLTDESVEVTELLAHKIYIRKTNNSLVDVEAVAGEAITATNNAIEATDTLTESVNTTIASANSLLSSKILEVNTAIDSANTATANTNSVIILADAATLNANNAAGSVDTSIINADAAATNADTATLNANNAANAANDATINANNKATLADAAATNADTATLNANNAANAATINTVDLVDYDINLLLGSDFNKNIAASSAFTISNPISKKPFRVIITGGSLSATPFTGYTANWILAALPTDYNTATTNYLWCEVRSAGQIYLFWGA